MDIRGIEVTNQLRSAIRAKLLELGVRYDEELPDYILVMVVNKKSRQQMHEDLYLFLEDSTTPFVDWLHDQVLKKLQKVTVAKKKSSREFVPMVVVKQEEERKKKKTSTTSFLEDQVTEQPNEKPFGKNAKEEKSIHKQGTKSFICNQNSEANYNKNLDKCPKNANNENESDNPLMHTSHQDTSSKKTQQNDVQDCNTGKNVALSEASSGKSGEQQRYAKTNNISFRNLKRPSDVVNDGHEISGKKNNDAKKSKVAEENVSLVEDSIKKLKSCVNKPKITSVVSVKNRLGIISPRKKFEVYREKSDSESRYRQVDKRFEKNRFESRNPNFQRNRNFETDERLRKSRNVELKQQETDNGNDIKNRLGVVKNDRLGKPIDLKDKGNVNTKLKVSEKSIGTVKDRLGVVNVHRSQKALVARTQEALDYKNTKCLEQDRNILSKNIKHRLGPLKNNFKPMNAKSNLFLSSCHSQSSEDDDCLNLGAEEEINDETYATVNTGPIKSHIIAVKKTLITKTDKKRVNPLEKISKKICSDIDDEDIEEAKLPSKVIVTPRPLKPLQPIQKRATQSLLLRAVAEANQSVVTQKNPEPCLLEKKSITRHRPPVSREIGQSLSVRFNASKRLVMEKIQVELNTTDSLDTEPKHGGPQTVTDEHMGVVMSLFQRSDNNQKFLVTLNGYNNNLAKEKTSDDEERLEMELNEDDEMSLLTVQNDISGQSESELNVLRITELEDDGEISMKERSEENNENCNTENMDVVEDMPVKRRKLSPIVYNRTDSSVSTELKSTVVFSSVPINKRTDKKSLTETGIPTVIDKSKEKCRYWPTCTLGNKCAFLHPAVMCSAFPACKFGDKCAYKHPKCKFGLSCTKLGCVFSHPAQQCKYHPFCSKPACPYSHPQVATQPTLSVEAIAQRAKFTWRRRD